MLTRERNQVFFASSVHVKRNVAPVAIEFIVFATEIQGAHRHPQLDSAVVNMQQKISAEVRKRLLLRSRR